MSTLHRTVVAAAVSILVAACSSSGAIGRFSDGGGAGGGGAGGGGGNTDASVSVEDSGTSPVCFAFGQACASAAECCSGLCDSTAHTCVASINHCTAAGGGCQSATECCSLNCSGGLCSANACVADGQACSSSAACCGGNCSAGVCEPLSTTCHSAGNPCTENANCCSGLCSGGTCKLGSSFCIQTGDACNTADQCCSGECLKGTGTLGKCAPPPTGATYCSDGVDGTLCDACNGCCSRLCAPYALTGVRVCQPASGCRVNGDLCRKDSDCCGAAGTGLPGDGNVTCEIAAGKTMGICRNPKSCNPQGNVCHFQNYACSISSARNDCCGVVGNSGVCEVDPLGVPRCNGLGTTCRKGGETCASAADCCNKLPCIPDATGVLRCFVPPATVDGGVPSSCVPAGGACSINGDCCVGTTCIQPIGSTKGICGTVVSPPPSTSDAGTSSGPDVPAPSCALYGQACTTAADCCNGIACTDGHCIDQIIL